jgi:hypothetical protein
MFFQLPSMKYSRRGLMGEAYEGSAPRYFFIIRGRNRVKDDTNLPDVAAALSNAERKIRDLRKENEYDDPSLMMIVKDEAGQTVLSLPFFPGY